MAIKLTFNTKFGSESTPVTGEYHKITEIRGSNIEISLYASEDAKDDNATYLQRFNYISPSSYFDESVLKNDGVSLKTQAYDYLKTLDVFSGYTDV